MSYAEEMRKAYEWKQEQLAMGNPNPASQIYENKLNELVRDRMRNRYVKKYELNRTMKTEREMRETAFRWVDFLVERNQCSDSRRTFERKMDELRCENE